MKKAYTKSCLLLGLLIVGGCATTSTPPEVKEAESVNLGLNQRSAVDGIIVCVNSMRVVKGATDPRLKEDEVYVVLNVSIENVRESEFLLENAYQFKLSDQSKDFSYVQYNGMSTSLKDKEVIQPTQSITGDVWYQSTETGYLKFSFQPTFDSISTFVVLREE